jgi:hypothetical protein
MISISSMFSKVIENVGATLIESGSDPCERVVAVLLQRNDLARPDLLHSSRDARRSEQIDTTKLHTSQQVFLHSCVSHT